MRNSFEDDQWLTWWNSWCEWRHLTWVTGHESVYLDQLTRVTHVMHCVRWDFLCETICPRTAEYSHVCWCCQCLLLRLSDEQKTECENINSAVRIIMSTAAGIINDWRRVLGAQAENAIFKIINWQFARKCGWAEEWGCWGPDFLLKVWLFVRTRQFEQLKSIPPSETAGTTSDQSEVRGGVCWLQGFSW